MTADPPSILNSNGKKGNTALERRNQERRAKAKALSKQTGPSSPGLDLLLSSSDEGIFSYLDLFYDLDNSSDRELDETVCNGSPPMVPPNAPPPRDLR